MYKPYMGGFMSTMMGRDFQNARERVSEVYARVRLWRKLNRLAVDRIHR